MKYRADINGLRAIAVLAVVLFHLDRDWLPRGYLGVDLFFVLSGYLITSLIWREAVERRFSLLVFYQRRIRRLMPALLAVLFVTSLASAAILLPADLMGYGKSVLSALGFVANVYFWRDTNYFARASEEKPLLHLWTLSVEEQFYIFFPLLLVVLVRFPRSVLPTIWALTIGSLVANGYLIRIGGASPAFYLLPTRAWELGIGALCALHPIGARPFGRIAAPLRWVGLALILVGVAYVGPWPEVVPVAFPVVLGTAILIRVGAPIQSRLGRFLAARVMRHLGEISYSLYLWHWPVIVLGAYVLVRPPTLAVLIGWGLLSLFLAQLSWRYVEQPLRARSVPFRRVGVLSGIGALVVAALALLFVVTGGLPGRLSPDVTAINRSVGTHYRCPVPQLFAFGASRGCDLTLDAGGVATAQVVLVGNSHAQMYAPLVRDALERAGQRGFLVPLNACLPMPEVNISTGCASQAATNLDAIRALPEVETVIVALDWPLTAALVTPQGAAINGRADAALADAALDYARALAPRRVVVVGPIAVPGFDIASNLGRELRFGIEPHSPTSTDAQAFRDSYGALFERLSQAPDITLVRPDLIQCDGAHCDFVRGNLALFADSNHIAQPALALFAPIFRDLLAPDAQR